MTPEEREEKQKKLNEEQTLLCMMLGLDPAVVTEIRIHITPGQEPTLQWTSRRHLPFAEIAEALKNAAPWTVPEDPRAD